MSALRFLAERGHGKPLPAAELAALEDSGVLPTFVRGPLNGGSVDGLTERIDVHVEKMRRKYPGVLITRSHAVRALLLAALKTSEQEIEDES